MLKSAIGLNICSLGATRCNFHRFIAGAQFVIPLGVFVPGPLVAPRSKGLSKYPM
jgi:hypothetical protein